MTKISQLSSIGDSLAIGDQFLIRDIDDATTPNKSVTISGITRALDTGTALAPALAFASDKNTGLYSPGADQVALSTGGTQRLSINANGLLSTTAVTPAVASFTGPANAYIDFTDGTGIFRTQLNSNTPFIGSASNHGLILATNNTERLRITSTGNVGIGTSSPNTLLDVNGAITANGDGSQVGMYLSGFARAIRDTGTASTVYLDLATGSASHGEFVIRSSNAVTERMRITSTGNVGIGTSAPGQALDVAGVINSQGNATTLVHYQAQDTGAAANENTWRIAQTLRTPKSLALGVTVNDAGSTAYAPITIVRSGVSLDNIQFATGTGTERARIDSSGRLLVGSSSSLNFAGVQFASQITTGTGTPARGQLISYFQADANGPFLALCKSRSNTLGTHAYPSSGDNLGTLAFGGSNEASARFDTYSSISSFASETWSATARGSELRFLTTADGAASPTERMRITSTGNVGIGTSSPSSLLHVESNLAGNNQIILTNIASSNSGAGSEIVFTQGASGHAAGKIQCDREGSYTATASTHDSALAFFTAADGVDTERLRITSAGNVGIGTSSPGAVQHNYSASQELLRLESTNATGAFMNLTGPSGTALLLGTGASLSTGTATEGAIRSPNSILFASGGSSERARIDSSGRLLVGTSTSRSALAVTAALQVEGTSFNGGSMQLATNTNDAQSPYFTFVKSRGTTLGSNTVVQNADNLGQIRFCGADGGAVISGAQIKAEVDGTPGADDMPGRLVFSTTADGAATPTEAMRINNQRELLIGTTTRTANGGVLQISNGITFPGTQSACSDANTLDDYEEGTFTPTIVGTTLAGTGTYTVQVGRYTKVGNRVFFQCYVVWTAHTGTGNMDLGGLPFTTSAVTNSFSPAAIWSSNVAHTASNVLQSYAAVNSTQVLIRQVPTGGGASAVVAIDTAGEIMITGHYFV